MTRESKIITSVIILALIAFAIIAIIFIPLPAISTYNQALSVADYKERMGIIYEIEELEKLDKYGEEYSKSFNSVDHMQIINSRKKMFGNGARAITVDGQTFYTYLTLDKMLDTSLNYFVALSKSIEGASRSEQRQVERLASSFKLGASNLVNAIADLKTSQKSNLESEDDIKMLSNKYVSVQNNYRELIKTQANLIIKLNELVNKHSFNGEYVDTTYSVLLSSFAYSFKESMEMEFQAENGYLLDSSLIYDNIEKYVGGTNIFTAVSEREFIYSYRNIYKNYISGLEKMFKLTHNIKSNVVNRDDFANSDIKTEFQKDVRIVLTQIGIK